MCYHIYPAVVTDSHEWVFPRSCPSLDFNRYSPLKAFLFTLYWLTPESVSPSDTRSASDIFSHAGASCVKTSYVELSSPFDLTTSTPYCFNRSEFLTIRPAIVFKPLATCVIVFEKIRYFFSVHKNPHILI